MKPRSRAPGRRSRGSSRARGRSARRRGPSAVSSAATAATGAVARSQKAAAMSSRSIRRSAASGESSSGLPATSPTPSQALTAWRASALTRKAKDRPRDMSGSTSGSAMRIAARRRAARFIAVRVAPEISSQEGCAIPAAEPGSALTAAATVQEEGSLEITLPDGTVLRMREQVGASTLRRVLAVLRG